MSKSIQIGPQTVLRPAGKVELRPENDGVVILSGSNRMPFTMNASAAEMWELIATQRSFGDAVATLSARYPQVGLERLTQDFGGLVARLMKEEYVEIP